MIMLSTPKAGRYHVSGTLFAPQDAADKMDYALASTFILACSHPYLSNILLCLPL